VILTHCPHSLGRLVLERVEQSRCERRMFVHCADCGNAAMTRTPLVPVSMPQPRSDSSQTRTLRPRESREPARLSHI
jgi:hypothetical protein